MTTLLSFASGWPHHGWPWPWLIVPLLWLLAFLLIAGLVWRGRRGPWSAYTAPPPPDPRAILAERYARGEIGHDEYRERLGHLDA